MAGKVALITNKPTGSLVGYNADNGEFYVLKCDTEGVLTTKGEIDATIDFEVGHGKTLLVASNTISTATTTAAIAAGGAGVITYVYGVKFTGISATKQTITLKKGTTRVDNLDLQSVGDATAGVAQLVGPDGYIFSTAANEAVNIVSSATVAFDYQLLYWQE